MLRKNTMLRFLLLAALTSFSCNASAYVIEFIDSGQSMGGNAQSNGIVMGDLDGDGDLDAFVANRGGNTVWLYDPAIYRFTDSGQSLGTAVSSDVALGDVDDDRDLDVFVVNDGGPNKVWLNNGAGQFTDSGQNLGSANSLSIALADIDNDGDIDAFVGNDGPNTVWRNNGSGAFADTGQKLGDSNSNGVELADLDADGHPDAFVANIGNPKLIWMNDGNGHFSDSGQTLSSKNSIDVELGDLDGDGDLDAFISNYFFQPNSVWLNNGTGTFSKTSQDIGKGHSYGSALGDVDKDGDLDAFVVNNGKDVLWLNDGKGKFIDSGLVLGDGNSQEILLEDIDNDGDLDAFIVNLGEGNTLWFNQGELILTIRPDNLPGDLIAFFTTKNIIHTPLFDNTRGDAALKRALGISRTYLLTPTPHTDLEALRSLLNARADVESCIYNQPLWFDEHPNDPYYEEEGNLTWIGMEEYWGTYGFPGKADVALAIIDKPVDITHEDLTDNIVPYSESRRDCTKIICTNGDSEEPGQCETYDIPTELPPPEEHGTHVAGIAAAVTNNNQTGIASVAGNSSSIMPLAVGSGAYAELDDVFRAIEFAVDSKSGVREDSPSPIPTYKAVIINMSLSSSFAQPDFDLAAVDIFHKWIRYAHKHGVPMITSTGNMNSAQSHYPASYPETIATGAVEQVSEETYRRWKTDDQMGSNFGFGIDLVAPGVDVLSTFPMGSGQFDGYDFSSGTSAAAPHVTGVMGLMLNSLLSNNPEQQVTTGTIEEFRWILRETAIEGRGTPEEDTPGWDQFYGSGLVNAAQALSALHTEQYISIEPTFHDFGKVSIAESAVYSVTIENSCARPLSINLAELKVVQLEIDPEQPTPDEFYTPQFSTNSIQVDNGRFWIFPVEFRPQSSGVKRAKLMLPVSFFSCATDAPSATTLTIPLVGTGHEPVQPQPYMLRVMKAGDGDGIVKLTLQRHLSI